MCCLDLGRPLEWRWGKSSLVKKCCNNPNNVPVLAPQHNLSSQELRDLDKGEYQQTGAMCRGYFGSWNVVSPQASCI